MEVVPGEFSDASIPHRRDPSGGGLGLLRGRNWARWLLVAWMVFHVGLSVYHSLAKVPMHSAIFAPILYFLFRHSSANWFRPDTAAPG
jgi:hypothetical protein